jgi:hypothetical protein
MAGSAVRIERRLAPSQGMRAGSLLDASHHGRRLAHSAGHRRTGYFDVDASILEFFKVTEHAKPQLRAEAFSVTNTPSFDVPGKTAGSSTIGVVTTMLASGALI